MKIQKRGLNQLNAERRRRTRQRVIARDGLECKICFRSLTVREVTLDHIVPRAKGGRALVSNLQVACYNCNHLKADK